VCGLNMGMMLNEEEERGNFKYRFDMASVI
jgi:hypothetical protein